MKENDIRLVAFDIDGTLLNNRNQIAKQTMQAIQALQQKGLYVTLVSGRTFTSIYRIAQQLALGNLLVAYNGAYVAESLKEPIFRKTMEWHVILPLLEKLQRENVYTKVYIDDILYVEKETDETIRFSKDHGVSYEETGVGRLSMLNQDVLKIVVIEDHERTSEVYEMLSPWHDQLTFFVDKTGIEIVHQGINKSVGIKKICNRLGIEMEQVMAFGNEANDVEMIRDAGIGVAMGNAIASLKETADFVTKTNEEDGIVSALRHYQLLI